MKIAVVGTGYVGLVTGVCLAETGNTVICVDIDDNKIAKLQNGEVPIYEPYLDVYLERNIKGGRITFTKDLQSAVEQSQFVFFALPTPDGGDGAADLSFVLDAAAEVAGYINDYKIIINKSTVPVGTAEKVRAAISPRTTHAFDVVSNPEFLREGFAVEDFMKPDRVVIGTSSDKAAELMTELYMPYVSDKEQIILMDERSAELTKYAANSFLALKITFMNEMARLCELTGANVDHIRHGIGTDGRIGPRFLFPGIGYGGSCFPKDVKALVKSAQDFGYDFSLIKAVHAVNEEQKKALVPKILKHFGGDIKGKTFAVWGLSFKPETDDMREAPSIYTIKGLLEAGADVIAFDPEAMDNARRIFADKITFADNQYDMTKNADALIICTEWAAFRKPDFEVLSANLNNKVIFDGRNLFNPQNIKKEGFTYISIGRPIL
jgi:UDPglucose 6-dehydrogenase